MSSACTSSSGAWPANRAALPRNGSSHSGNGSVGAKRRVEVVVPTERWGQALAKPSVESERRQSHCVDGRHEHLLLIGRDDGVGLYQTREARPLEQLGLHWVLFCSPPDILH